MIELIVLTMVWLDWDNFTPQMGSVPETFSYQTYMFDTIEECQGYADAIELPPESVLFYQDPKCEVVVLNANLQEVEL